MADNYLEIRMEELRSGKLAVSKAIPGIRPKAPRVLVVGGCHGIAREKALEFRRQGCRVAVFDPDAQVGRKMAYEHGIRFHRVDISDGATLRNEIESLLKVWHGLDVVSGTHKQCDVMETSVKNWKESLPIADKSPFEIVIIDETPRS